MSDTLEITYSDAAGLKRQWVSERRGRRRNLRVGYINATRSKRAILAALALRPHTLGLGEAFGLREWLEGPVIRRLGYKLVAGEGDSLGVMDAPILVRSNVEISKQGTYRLSTEAPGFGGVAHERRATYWIGFVPGHGPTSHLNWHLTKLNHPADVVQNRHQSGAARVAGILGIFAGRWVSTGDSNRKFGKGIHGTLRRLYQGVSNGVDVVLWSDHYAQATRRARRGGRVVQVPAKRVIKAARFGTNHNVLFTRLRAR